MLCPFPHIDIDVLFQEPVSREDLPEECPLCGAPLTYSEDLRFEDPSQVELAASKEAEQE